MKLLRNEKEYKKWISTETFLVIVTRNVRKRILNDVSPREYPCFITSFVTNGQNIRTNYLYRSDLERMLKEMK
jgi:hypothetical protein